MNPDPVIQQVIDEAKAKGNFERNSAYTNGDTNYQTKLDPLNEMAFQKWAGDNNVPYSNSPTADYDMRGFYQGVQSGDPNARQAVNSNDGKMHFSDYWKTPYHDSFSAESKFADKKKAPNWNEKDQLVSPGGKILVDEKKKKDTTSMKGIIDSMIGDE